METSKTIAIVEDDPDVAKIIEQVLGDFGFRTVWCRSASDLLRRLRTLAPDEPITTAELRRLLAAVLGCAPQALSVSDARGIPPRLGWTTGGRSGLDAIGLSISHAPGLSLVAWCPKGAVGVDVQAVPYATDRAELWRKLAVNCVINPLTALWDCPNGELRQIGRASCRERVSSPV